MSVIQLELDLWQQLAVAEEYPEQTNVEQLCLGLDLMLTQVSPKRQLEMAGEAFLQIAEVFNRRADMLLNDWKQAHSEEGPVLDLGELEVLVRQSMVFDLDELFAEPELVTRRTFPKEEGDSVVAIVEKEVLLQELELQQPEEVFAVIEEENVAAWVDAIAQRLRARGGSDSAIALQQHLELSWGRLWLGLLLGGFELESDRFYSREIEVSCVR
ncbi:hypothetical protein C1752_08966 [Acaryochloris thomasi RCC1774]|uniref:Uncharacterized protein n=1 Tax=Acaryochloris thomasi RCC1774 TaxID=1764569 RepID=A0A2W1JKV1_9CYAN|nr:hypothetical protein [Acaryochloris thomasi]PZD70824.1 hypothetical protein C1752_08966 [Acaryochloris thomasi RCC1774]